MSDRSEAFKAELKALMNKYAVRMDFVEDCTKVNFYTDGGIGDAVTLQFDLESEFYQDPADCIA